MELRVSTDSILRCRGPLCDWDMESVLAREASSSSIIPPPPSPPPSPSSELEPPSPERRDRRSPDCRFWRLSDGARPRLFQLDRRLVQPLPELQGACGEALRALVWRAGKEEQSDTKQEGGKYAGDVVLSCK